ncbi:micronuclear linker histone polyprotein-like [Spodoptera litura]|uniref:Micronuclear linker histone polyprotein-like n=1 Tax=Spodoptera litura TaxID=69820 RepID=A0A9J7IJZ9_SPOLT|nr:micronuclear linker histone polyprotein-like [Spodoptera litura]
MAYYDRLEDSNGRVSSSNRRRRRRRTRWDHEEVQPPSSTPLAVYQRPMQLSDMNYNKVYYYQDNYYPYYNLMHNNNATYAAGYYYTSYPYNTYSQNYDGAAYKDQHLYSNQLLSNYSGYYTGDQTGLNALTHELANYCYFQQENDNQMINQANTTEYTTHNNQIEKSRQNKPSRDIVGKKEQKPLLKGNTLGQEILNTKEMLRKKNKRSHRTKESKKRTKSASEQNRHKKKKSTHRHCRSSTRTVTIERKYRSLSPASYKRYMDFQRFLINYYASLSKYRVKTKIFTQSKNEILKKEENSKTDKQIESTSQQNALEKIHELGEDKDESSVEQNKQGEQDKVVEIEQTIESKSSRKRTRSHSALDSEKATDKNENQEITQKDNSETPSKRYVKVRLNLNIENPTSTSESSESDLTTENLSFVDEIDVDKIVKLLNLDENEETVSTEDIQNNERGNAHNEEMSQNMLISDKLPNDNTSNENALSNTSDDNHQAKQMNKLISTTNHTVIDLTQEEGEIKENKEYPKMPKVIPKTKITKVDKEEEPVLADSPKNMAANRTNSKTSTKGRNKEAHVLDKSEKNKAITRNNPIKKKSGTKSQDSKKQQKELVKETNVTQKQKSDKSSKGHNSQKDKNSTKDTRSSKKDNNKEDKSGKNVSKSNNNDKKRRIEKRGSGDNDDCVITQRTRGLSKRAEGKRKRSADKTSVK